MCTHSLSEESSINWSYLKFEISLKTGNDPSTNLIGNIMRLQVWQTSPLHLGQQTDLWIWVNGSGSIAQEHVFWYIKTVKTHPTILKMYGIVWMFTISKRKNHERVERWGIFDVFQDGFVDVWYVWLQHMYIYIYTHYTAYIYILYSTHLHVRVLNLPRAEPV